MSEMETREGHTPGSALVSPMLEDLWAMRTTVANYSIAQAALGKMARWHDGYFDTLLIEADTVSQATTLKMPAGYLPENVVSVVLESQTYEGPTT